MADCADMLLRMISAEHGEGDGVIIGREHELAVVDLRYLPAIEIISDAQAHSFPGRRVADDGARSLGIHENPE
jgi:hypothetical protein